MATQTDICNFALNSIGSRSISSLTDGSKNAAVCALFYSQARQITLRSCPWNFATKIATLNLLTNETLPGWELVYEYPGDCLFLRKIFNLTVMNYNNPFLCDIGFAHHSVRRLVEYQIAKGATVPTVIGSHLGSAQAEYTSDVQDEGFFDATFIEALKYQLAALIAKSCTGDDAVTKMSAELFMQAIGIAKTTNYSEQLKNPIQYSEYVDAR